MSDRVQWTLLHRFEDGLPVEFFEVRRNRETIWTCAGRTKTFGSSEVLRFEDAEAADSAFDRLLSDARRNGLVEVAGGAYEPGQFDFIALKDAVKTASRLCFEAMLNANGDEQLRGFGLLTDPDLMTIVGVGQSADAIAGADPEDQAEALWFVGEWTLDDGDEHFDIPYRMILRQSRDDIPVERKMDDGLFADGCFEAFVSALEELRSEGAFARAGEALVLLVEVSDSDEIEGMAERLNPDPEVLSGYHDLMG